MNVAANPGATLVAAVHPIDTVALAGWLLGIPVLTSIVPGWPRMAPLNIVCFFLCVAALFASTLPAGKKPFELTRMIAAGIVLAISTYALIDYTVRGGPAVVPPKPSDFFGLGRPSPATAFNFLVAAAAFMLPCTDRGKIYSGLIAAGLAVTGLNFVGYAYGIAALSRGPTVTAMSLPTMASFVLLFVSALLARPHAGWPAIIFARNSS